MHSARLAEGMANLYQVMVVAGDGGGQIEATQRNGSPALPPLEKEMRSFEDAYMHFTAKIRKCHT